MTAAIGILRCSVPRLEAALDGEPPSVLCPHRAEAGGNCLIAQPDCRIFAPGWYCEDRDLIVFPELLRDPDFEPNGDDEPDADDEPSGDYDT